MAYIDTRRSLILEETVSRTAYVSRGVPAARARITVAVIGGGVMAAAVAHLLGQHPEFDITLFERDVAPGEATASNHGRMHSGGSSMLFDSPEITARKTAGLATFGAVGLDVFDTTETAAYAFEREAERAAFVTRAAWAGVAVDQRAGFDALTLDQFGPSIRHVVGLIEHATNFARVRSQLLARAEACGAELRFGSAVERVEAMAGNRMRLWSGDAALGAFDVVLNMAGRFAQNIRVDDHPPLDPKQQVRWPVFLTPLARLPGPNRVLTVIDAEH
ncbi:MAG: FAD-dependent oxidoreductase [Defluviicoccus sp.]|nr:MAG: FAD-dependent oxidoreductase [Defluviicoccus sp.]